ncbi:MAG: hypothetical protein RIR51_723 [Bacteroidota bacterium]|jgi:DNA polymerase (family 10)
MLNNEEIIDSLELLVKLWTLHDYNEFKIRNLSFALRSMEKFPNNLANASDEELLSIPGVKDSILKILKEYIENGYSPELESLLAQTPKGLLDILKIKGLGPKMTRQIWINKGVTDLTQLESICKSGELESIKGFGKSMTANILEYIDFMKSNANKVRIHVGTELALIIQNSLNKLFNKVEISGELRRNSEVISVLSFVVETEDSFGAGFQLSSNPDFKEDFKNSSPFIWRGNFQDKSLPIEIFWCSPDDFIKIQFQQSSAPKHLEQINFFEKINSINFQTEKTIYQSLEKPFIPIPMREGHKEWEWAEKYQEKDLIQYQDLKGCVHNHSTYSDGKNTLLEMAESARSMGLSYFGIADHGQYLAFANGMQPERVEQQHREIDELNKKWTDFKILKGVEADILPDGSLDYNPEILASFDYVVASVHVQLGMDLDKAMNRVLRAIENPYTSILGHPTGRLLLERKGFPLDYNIILDACKANKVAVELNASPYRLDIDWRFLYLALEKDVMVSINPDSHQKDKMVEMEYGVKVAQKGGLIRDLTFNTLNMNEFLNYKK